MEKEIIYDKTSEEYKAIKLLESKITNYSDDGLILHYNIILYNLIINLMKENKKQQEIIDKVNNYLDNYDVFKVFSFPLMKKWEEQEVKSSIDYEFKKSLIKDLKEILEDKEV